MIRIDAMWLASDPVLNDVFARLPNHLNKRIDELLPQHWKPAR